jgi:hypothetical protein
MKLFVNYTGSPDGDATLSTPADVDTVLDEVQRKVSGQGALLMLIGPADDAEGNGPLLQVGIDGDKGVLTYDGESAPDGLLSHGGDVDGLVFYSYQGTKAEFPASAEVPYDVVKQAVKEFLRTDGARPSTPEWRADTD